jgi:hypothetical protein
MPQTEPRPPGDQFRCDVQTGRREHGLRWQSGSGDTALGGAKRRGASDGCQRSKPRLAAPALPAHSKWPARRACPGSESRLQPARCATRSNARLSTPSPPCQRLSRAHRANNSGGTSTDEPVLTPVMGGNHDDFGLDCGKTEPGCGRVAAKPAAPITINT